jgi:phytoene synthase
VDVLERSYAGAEAVTAEWAKSFHFASRFLPGPKRRAIFAIYEFCRHADNLVDERGTRSIAAVRDELIELDATVRALHAGAGPVDVRWLALHDTLRRYAIPLEPLTDLLVGVAIDLEPVEFADYRSLHRYCELVAGGVGLMLGPVLGVTDPRSRDPGISLGVAMQLTNIIRDIGEDLDRNRVYLPREELERFGLTRADLARRVVTPAVAALLQFQVSRARRTFEAADDVIRLFPRDGSRLTVRLMQQTYAGILDVIKAQGYDVFARRAFTSRARKLAILAQALWIDRDLATPVPRTRSA